jgi:chemotaxis protein MotB
MSRRRRGEESEQTNTERWLVSYADFMTLLFIVFLILFSFSQVDQIKFRALINSFTTPHGLGNSVIFEQPGSAMISKENPSPVNDPLGTQDDVSKLRSSAAYKKEQENFEKLKREIEDFAKKEGILNNLKITIDERGLAIRITGEVLFETGKADLTAQSKKILDGIFEKLAEIDNPIRIEGYTDNVPIHTAQFPSNWELSAIRSTHVARYLIENKGFLPERLSTAGYGEYKPVADNRTPEGRAQNRRVEIIVLRQYGQTAPIN